MTMLTMKNGLDEHLQQLAKEAKISPPNSRERRQALDKLLSLIIKSDRLRPMPIGLLKGFYEDIHSEALQRLYIYIVNNIEDYEPERGKFCTWANFLLRKRFFPEAFKDVMSPISAVPSQAQVQILSLDDLGRDEIIDINSQPNSSLFEEVIDLIKSDPEGIFSKTFLADNPAVNFKNLALKRISGYSWKELAEEYEISVSTLSTFYQRCLSKLSPKFKKYLFIN